MQYGSGQLALNGGSSTQNATASVSSLYTADVLSYNDYYPFGMLQPGRNGNANSYRYGFNGMEKDNEIKGSGNSLDFGARMYDSRTGRWLSLDPLAVKYPFASPYNFVLNTPIWAMDPDGRVVKFANRKSKRLFKKIYKSADEATKTKLDVLKNSDVVYRINAKGSLKGRQGSSQYNFDKSRFDIIIDKGARNKVGVLGDELTHASQFENGEIGYVRFNNGLVRTLGFDMEDEVNSKRGEIRATKSVDEAEGTNKSLDKTTQKFKKADTFIGPLEEGKTHSDVVGDRVENYFATDPSAKRYLENFDPRGKQMGVHIPGNGGYTEERLNQAVKNGQFKDFIYREKQQYNQNKTVQGSSN